MNDLSLTKLWLMRASFVLLTLAILFFHLLPLDITPSRWAGPDLLLCFACAWSLRRPEYVPALSLALMFLLADFLLQRPPGLYAVLALLACENLKSRGRTLRDANFVAEWVTVGVMILILGFANRLILGLVLLDLPSLTLFLSEIAMTILFYPVVVAIAHYVMGIRKAAPGDLDALGQRV